MSWDVLKGLFPFLPVFLLTFGVGCFLFSILLFWGKKWLIPLRYETGRFLVRAGITRFGGIVVVISFWCGLAAWSGFEFSMTTLALLIGSIGIALFGFFDDIHPIPWWWQLIFQLALGGLLLLLGMRIEIMQGVFGGTIDFRNWSFPGAPSLILILWLLLVINAVNWLDGLDGLLGSVSLIGFGTLSLVSLFPEVHQPGLAAPSVILFGATLAFLIFNWPPARLMAGTTGAYFLGFSLAVLAVSAGAKVATTLLVLFVPILDALFVLWERYHSGVSLFVPDGRHLHYRLMELGWHEKQIALLYTALTLGMAIFALSTRTIDKILVFFVASACLLSLMVGVKYWSRSLRQQK